MQKKGSPQDPPTSTARSSQPRLTPEQRAWKRHHACLKLLSVLDHVAMKRRAESRLGAADCETPPGEAKSLDNDAAPSAARQRQGPRPLLES